MDELKNISAAIKTVNEKVGQPSKMDLPVIQRQISQQGIPLHYQYDNIYGLICISTIAKQLSDHPWFQRLKYIKQLGPLHFKFAYANHSRFEHSIGVAYLARLAGNVLQEKSTSVTDREILCLELAAMFHDFGHGAGSHSFDNLLYAENFQHNTKHHEVRSQILVRYLIESTSDHQITDDEIRLIQYFIDTETYELLYPGEKPPKFTDGLEQIVSNPVHKLDVDKMDYLRRDAQALRFDITIDGDLDTESLIRRSELVSDKKTGKTYWMFHIRDQGTVYDLICRRFVFYNNYYVHPEVHSINCMLTDALSIANKVYKFTDCVKLKTLDDVHKFIMLTDEYFLNLLLNTTDNRLKSARKLVENIIQGVDWYKHMGDFVTNIDNMDTSAYVEIPWKIFTDKSTPTTLLPKVRYHQNGEPIDANSVTNTRRLFRKV